MDKLRLNAPTADVLHKVPQHHLKLGSDFTRNGADSLAFHFLGLKYQMVFISAKNREKDLLKVV